MDSKKARISTTSWVQLMGKHIRIRNLEFSGSHYYIYKKFFTMVLLANVDADNKFTFVDVRTVGLV